MSPSEPLASLATHDAPLPHGRPLPPLQAWSDEEEEEERTLTQGGWEGKSFDMCASDMPSPMASRQVSPLSPPSALHRSPHHLRLDRPTASL